MNDFKKALQKFDINASELESTEICDQIQRYCILLWHKNQQMNLTRHTDWETFVKRDLVDTLQLSALIEQNSDLLDIGSGGGVPGMLLAIIRPDLNVSLTDSVGKKAKALAEFAERLELNVNIFQERAENILVDFRYDFVTARAVGSLSKLATWLENCWINFNCLLATKGPNWENERNEAMTAGLLNSVDIQVATEYPTPGEERKSYILKLSAKRAPE